MCPPTYKTRTHVGTNKTRRSDQRGAWISVNDHKISPQRLNHTSHGPKIKLYTCTYLQTTTDTKRFCIAFILHLTSGGKDKAIARGSPRKTAWSGGIMEMRTDRKERAGYFSSCDGGGDAIVCRRERWGGVRASLGAKSVWRGAGVGELRRSGWHRARQCPSGC